MRARRSPGSRGWVPRAAAPPGRRSAVRSVRPVRFLGASHHKDRSTRYFAVSGIFCWTLGLPGVTAHSHCNRSGRDGLLSAQSPLESPISRDLLHDIHPCRGCRCVDTLPIARFPRSFARAFAASRSRHAMPLRRWHRQAEVEIRAASEGPEPVAGSAAEQAVSAVAADPRPLEVPATRAGARPEARHPPARLSGAPGALPQEAAPGALPQEAASARPTLACPTPPTVATTCIRS
jgi:hypothetical protein